MNFMFSWQEQHLTSEILILPLEHKIHIFLPPCNILYLINSMKEFTHHPKVRPKNIEEAIRPA